MDTQLTLPLVKSNRPSKCDESVKIIFKKNYGKKLRNFLKSNDEDYDDDCFEQLWDAIEFNTDTIRICKHLEDLGWEFDDALYHFINGVHYQWDIAFDQAQKNWVLNNFITLSRSIGEIVTFRHGLHNEIKTGEIMKLYKDEAKYLVCCLELGHVKTGIGIQGFLLNEENLL